ncbi:MAG: hypothetical protein R2802_10150 [Flavobacteriaceae bacterium]|nr:hypothetical protein [Mangrovimonas sp.]HPF97001.1 hypothetical protein [Mangrovimonas sp.]HRV53935.1 hypothetical protein [Mangrovimonas sp.]
MKKYITIFGVFAAFLIGTQFVNAQDKRLSKEQLIEKAQLDTKKLSEIVGGLNEEQEAKVIKVYYEMESNLDVIAQDERSKPRIPVLMEAVDTRLSKILDEKQNKLYLQSKQ